MGFTAVLFLMFSVAGECPSPVLSSIIHELQSLSTNQLHCARQNAELLARVAGLERCMLEIAISRQAVGVCPEPAPPALVWMCPVCSSPFRHRDSFKGHVRKLKYSSSRPKCVLSPSSAAHLALVHRFAGDDFKSQAEVFRESFYSFVRAVCCAQMSVGDSHALICTWCDAAIADDFRPFPEHGLMSTSQSSTSSSSAHVRSSQSVSSERSH